VYSDAPTSTSPRTPVVRSEATAVETASGTAVVPNEYWTPPPPEIDRICPAMSSSAPFSVWVAPSSCARSSDSIVEGRPRRAAPLQ